MGDQRPHRAGSQRPPALRHGCRGRIRRPSTIGPLIGFPGSPYTLACYMVEGGGSSDFRHVKTMLYDRPDLLHRILSVTADTVTATSTPRSTPGAQAVMIFRYLGRLPFGGRLPEVLAGLYAAHRRRAQEEKRRRARSLHRVHQERRPLAGRHRRHRLVTGSAWTGPSTSAKRAGGSATRWRSRATVDPNVLCRSRCCRRRAKRCWTAYGTGNTGHVFNLGHGFPNSLRRKTFRFWSIPFIPLPATPEVIG